MSFLVDQKFAKALEAIDLALSANHSPLLNIWRAHVLMFLGRADEAKTLYTRYRDDKVDNHSNGAGLILRADRSFTPRVHPCFAVNQSRQPLQSKLRSPAPAAKSP